MSNSIFFLSSGYKGGANEYIYQNLHHISKNYSCTIIDANKDSGIPKKSKKIKFYKLNLLKNFFKNKKELLDIFLKNRKKNNIIFFTNFAIFVIYFFLFKRLQKYNFKIVLTLHSGILVPNYKNIPLAFLFSILSFKLDKLIFGSNTSKNWWQQKFPWISFKESKIIYNGINLKRFNILKKIKNKKFNISFVGRLEPEHNPELFIKLASSPYLKNNNIKFHCFGDGPLKKIILNNQISFHGWAKPDKIYKITDIVIITSKLQNFPYVALEAKSCGIPVISCSKGDIKKIIFNNKDGFLFDSFDLEKMSKKILFIKKNYKFFSKNAKKYSKRFDEKKSLNKIWKYIKK